MSLNILRRRTSENQSAVAKKAGRDVPFSEILRYARKRASVGRRESSQHLVSWLPLGPKCRRVINQTHPSFHLIIQQCHSFQALCQHQGWFQRSTSRELFRPIAPPPTIKMIFARAQGSSGLQLSASIAPVDGAVTHARCIMLSHLHPVAAPISGGHSGETLTRAEPDNLLERRQNYITSKIYRRAYHACKCTMTP